MAKPLPPVHCPDDDDALLGWTKRGVCSPAHPRFQPGIELAADWLNGSLDALGDGRLSKVTVPMADSLRAVSTAGLDPQCSAVVLAQARVGPQDALGVYLGLVLQQPDGRWRGLAGSYLQLCKQCENPNKTSAGARRVQNALRARVPRLGAPTAPEKLPQWLAPGPGWWDERHVATYLIGPAAGSRWHSVAVGDLLAMRSLRGADTVLVRLGEGWTTSSQVMLLQLHDIERLAPLLPDQDEQIWIRVGPSALLERLASDPVHPAKRQHIRLGRCPPLDPPLIAAYEAGEGQRTVTLTRHPRRSWSELRGRGLLTDVEAADVWTLPRAGPGGAILGTQAFDLLDQLRDRGHGNRSNNETRGPRHGEQLRRPAPRVGNNEPAPNRS
jgi:hypothetical protein